jgi:hypothetical protein
MKWGPRAMSAFDPKRTCVTQQLAEGHAENCSENELPPGRRDEQPLGDFARRSVRKPENLRRACF